MKIAIVTQLFGFHDGQGRVNYEIARAALEAGHELTLVAHECDERIAKHPRARFIQIKESSIPTQFMRNLSFAVRSARWLRKFRGELDVIQANGFVTFEEVDIVAAHFVHRSWRKHPSYPFGLPSLKPYVLYQNLYTSYSSWNEPHVYGDAKAVVAVSRKTAREVEELGVDAAKIRVIYNGVDVETFHPGPPDRARFDIPPDASVALFVGDIRTPRKNLGTVLEAMRYLPDLHLVVAGDKSGSPFPAMAERLGVSQRVSFIGKTAEVALLMRSVDLFVFPSRYEAHPLVLMEALASGLPIFAARGIVEGEDFADACVSLQNCDDAEALSKAIAQVLNSPERKQELASAAREKALTMGWSVTAGKYLALYEEVARMKRQKSAAG